MCKTNAKDGIMYCVKQVRFYRGSFAFRVICLLYVNGTLKQTLCIQSIWLPYVKNIYLMLFIVFKNIPSLHVYPLFFILLIIFIKCFPTKKGNLFSHVTYFDDRKWKITSRKVYSKRIEQAYGPLPPYFLISGSNLVQQNCRLYCAFVKELKIPKSSWSPLLILNSVFTGSVLPTHIVPKTSLRLRHHQIVTYIVASSL
jgi:hypothetical protein